VETVKILKKKFVIFLFLTLIGIAPITNSSFSFASELIVTVTTEKPTYYYRQLVNVYGNVTYNNQLVEEGLVAVQIEDPNNETIALRTVPANAIPSRNWTVEIVSFISCDSNGNPKDTFRKKTNAYFKASVRNNAVSGSRRVILTITLYDSDSSPFNKHFLTIPELPPGTTWTELVSLYIDEWVSTGSAVACANAYTDWPKNEGYAYCPEKSAVFTITETTTTSTTASPSESFPLESGTGIFQAAFRLPPETPLGTYRVSVGAYYKGWKAFGNTTFSHEFKMREDVVFDHKIDIFDVVKVAAGYGSKGGDPDWDPEADIVPSYGKIDIYDVVAVCGKYGTSY